MDIPHTPPVFSPIEICYFVNLIGDGFFDKGIVHGFDNYIKTMKKIPLMEYRHIRIDLVDFLNQSYLFLLFPQILFDRLK